MAVSRNSHAVHPQPRPKPEPRPGGDRGNRQRDDVRIPRQMLEVCRSASLLLGGPNIRRLGITPHHRRAFGTVRMLSQLTLNLDFETVDVTRLDSLDVVVLESEASLEPAPV